MSDDSYSERLKNTKRNDPCPCGSGRKYKKCHLEQDEAALHAASKAAAEAAAVAAEAVEGAPKNASSSGVDRSTARQNKPARGAAGNPRPKNLPRRKAV
ncbi:MAG TPA: SEC-C metal-binding domain-containing protein [Polyangiaceae bacterium]|nr:SEC-C metal-binding domain-containing protein [Polyangiaceae bacterium]